MSRGALFTTPLVFDLGASWCVGVIALLKSQSLVKVKKHFRDLFRKLKIIVFIRLERSIRLVHILTGFFF